MQLRTQGRRLKITFPCMSKEKKKKKFIHVGSKKNLSRVGSFIYKYDYNKNVAVA